MPLRIWISNDPQLEANMLAQLRKTIAKAPMTYFDERIALIKSTCYSCNRTIWETVRGRGLCEVCIAEEREMFFATQSKAEG